MEKMVKLRVAVVSLLGLVIASGCSNGPRRAIPPAYDSDAGAKALDAYDTNRDGVISGNELDRIPALRASLRQVDQDGDERITADEIDRRVESWKKSRIAEMPVRCRVLLNGVPLVNAEVLFDPAPFLGPGVKPATGTTMEDGTAGMSLAKEHLADPRFPGVACGWYTIRVISSDRAIPDRYNVNSTLGCEVAIDAHWLSAGEVCLELKTQSNHSAGLGGGKE